MSKLVRFVTIGLQLAILTVWLSGCGGESDAGSPAPTPTPAPVACIPFTDSFGRSVTCAEMNSLAGANLAYLDAGGDAASGAGDGAADGTSGDGAPIANATLRFTDINGKEVTTTTDANGYYRVSLRGLKAPLVATVLREGNPWKSMLVEEIVRAPANRKFYTVNLTGLTDVVASKTVQKQGLTSTDALTPAIVVSQKPNIPQIVADLNAQLINSLRDAGLDPATFNPLTTPFVPNMTGYDLVLETNPTYRAPDGSTVLVNTKFAFSIGDQLVYRATPSTGPLGTSTETVLSISNSLVEKMQSTSSGTSTISVITYNGKMERVSDDRVGRSVCTYLPPRHTPFAFAVNQLTIGQSLASPFDYSCIYSDGRPQSVVTYSLTYTFLRTETITTPAGTFQNARVIRAIWSSTNPLAGFRDREETIWIDPIMARSVRSNAIETDFANNSVQTASELISKAVQNYPR